MDKVYKVLAGRWQYGQMRYTVMVSDKELAKTNYSTKIAIAKEKAAALYEFDFGVSACLVHTRIVQE